MSIEEITLLEELKEQQKALVLQPLKDFKTVGTVPGEAFIKQHGKNGIYISFIRKSGHKHTSSLPTNIKAQTLFDNLFEKNYINEALYIGSGNILDRCTAMRGVSMNTGAHGVARYRNVEGNVELEDIVVLFISMGELSSPDIKNLETRLHVFNEKQVGKRFIAYLYSSSEGENGTKQANILQQISDADQEFLDTILTACFTRNSTLKTMDLLQN